MIRNRWWILICGLVAALSAGPAFSQTVQVELAPMPKCCEKSASCPECGTSCGPAIVKDGKRGKRCEIGASRHSSRIVRLAFVDTECEIGKQLQMPISLDYKDTPLRQVISDLREWSGINFYLDAAGLKAEGVNLDHPITLKLEGVSLKTALDALLKKFRLSYTVVTPVFEGGAQGYPILLVQHAPSSGSETACSTSPPQPRTAELLPPPAKSEPSCSNDCGTKCCPEKAKHKKARIRVIAPRAAPVTYVPVPLPPPLPCPPDLSLMAAPMVAAPMLVPPPAPANAAAAPPTMILSEPVAEDVIKQCNFTVAAPAPAPPAPAWSMRVVKEDGKATVEFQSGRDTRIIGEGMTLKMVSGHHFGVSVIPNWVDGFRVPWPTLGMGAFDDPENQLSISAPGLYAHSDRVMKQDDSECIILEGHVRLIYDKEGITARIHAERVVLDMARGELQVKVGAPPANKPAAAEKDKLFQFWIGMFH